MEREGSEIPLHSGDADAYGVPRAIPYPDNLVLIGTVNMDETTMGISDKVLDQDVDGLAIRLFPFVRHDPWTARSLETLPAEPKIISLDPRAQFGRPVIVGTGIPTEEVAERFRAGDTCEQLADEYGRPPQEIEEAIRCELTLDRAA